MTAKLGSRIGKQDGRRQRNIGAAIMTVGAALRQSLLIVKVIIAIGKRLGLSSSSCGAATTMAEGVSEQPRCHMTVSQVT